MNSSSSIPPTDPSSHPDDSIDFGELFARFRRGFPITLGLALISLALGIVFALVATTRQPVVSALRVTFGFPGFERGVYPNDSKFQPDDIRAPDVINEAIKRLDVSGQTPDLASKIRGAISITGFVSPNIIKERDRLRATGQTLPPYIPDEYEISLSLPRRHPLAIRQRELLLAEIVNVYLEKFRRTYVELPPQFDNAFSSLKNADFVEYELILSKEVQSLRAYLEQQIDSTKDGNRHATAAKQFRSPTNRLSFQDVLKQTELFTQVKLNDVLSQIYIYGLSKDRSYAMVKMDYYLRTLQDQEQRLREDESVVTALLAKTQDRAQNYVLATKAQNPNGNQPMLDQGFIDSLLSNDAYNFLIRRALDAGLALKRVQADKALLQDRRQRMESFTKGENQEQSKALASTQKSLSELETSYQELLGRIRVILEDYARQEYADAVRISMQAGTPSLLISLAIGAAIGAFAGLTMGLGISLIQPIAAGNRN